MQSRALPPVGQQSRGGSFAEPDRGIVTGSIQAQPSAPQPVKSSDVGNWSTTGGTSLTVGAGETIATLSSRYGVPETALRAANNLKAGANPAPGSQIIIPVYRYGPAVGQSTPTKATSDRLAAQKREPQHLATVAALKKPTKEESKAAVTNRTVFIAGATSGIGLELARRFAAAGSDVIVGGRRADLLDEIAAEGFATVQIDVTDQASVDRARDTILHIHRARHHGADVRGHAPEDLRDPGHFSDAEQTIDTNLLGTIRVIDAFIRT